MNQTRSFNSPAQRRYHYIRTLKDKITRQLIAFGGISVIFAILLIFLYLFYEVMPLFQSASISRQSTYQTLSLDPPADKGLNKPQTLYLAMEEQAEIGLRLNQQGEAIFFNTADGEIKQVIHLPVPASVHISSFALQSPASRLFAVGLSNGSIIIAKHSYKISYPDDKRLITPYIEYPYGIEPITLSSSPKPITDLAIRDNEERLAIAAVLSNKHTVLQFFNKEEDFLSEEITLQQQSVTLPLLNEIPHKLLLSPDLRWFYLLIKPNQLIVLDLQKAQDGGAVELNKRINLTENHSPVSSISFLVGGISLLVADEAGLISQWFPVRDNNNRYQLQKIRHFSTSNQAIQNIVTEERRKGFMTVNQNGLLDIYHSTAERHLLSVPITHSKLHTIALSPRANALLVEDEQGQMSFWTIDNQHPEISWSALWHKVWYENYQQPEYTWQSSAANNDFEPKYSLIPLSFGTLKAAFYAMLLAAPLAICGAIFTAYFMAPSMRRKVKPLIELMEALPTVILGFLAGLWLAPFVENHLTGIFALMIFLFIFAPLSGLAWIHLPQSIRYRIPDGWEPALLIPGLLLGGYACVHFSANLEIVLFDGDMRRWITHDLGIDFDQRNSLIVGLAMGFAVIPTIFSIAEDAIFSVPKHLSYGSLALGANPWQTLIKVVLPTASPGIFSALMIGMGRAVGETMIVLMATGNTPIMDFNIFEGMRTLAANIAVEIPESEVGSSHYRVLFLAALVLFAFTFLVNTVAEIVRQRLRKKYGSL